MMTEIDLIKRSAMSAEVAKMACLDKYCMDIEVSNQIREIEKSKFMKLFSNLGFFAENVWDILNHTRNPDAAWNLYKEIT